MRWVALLVLAVSQSGSATASGVGPIQKILQLLTALETKVKEEGKVEEASFAKFTQWCHDGERDKGFEMRSTQGEIDDLEATIASYAAELSLVNSRVRDQSREIGLTEKDIKSAVAVRKEGREDYLENKKMMEDAMDELDRTINMVRKGMMAGTALLKTKGALLRVMVAFPDSAEDLSLPTRAEVDQWLQGNEETQKEAHAQLGLAEVGGSQTGKTSTSTRNPAAMGPMLDMLTGMREKIAKKADDANREEMNEQSTHQMMLMSLKDSLSRQQETLAADQQLGSEQKRAKAAAEGSLMEEQRVLAADQAYVQKLQQGCALRTQEWSDRQKERADEISAIREAYEVLSNPDAQAALGKAAMLQSESPALAQEDEDQVRRGKMVTFLKTEAQTYKSQLLGELADRAGSTADPFAKVKAMVENLIAKLLNEAAEESSHKSWCDEEEAKSEKSQKEKGEKVNQLQGRFDQANAAREKLEQDVTSLQTEVAEMDKGNAKATEIRNEEKAEYETNMKDYEKANAALSQAMAVLEAYYTKGSAAAAALVQKAKKQPSGSFGDYKKGDTSGVMGLLEVTQSDLVRMTTEAKIAEGVAQREYDELMEKSKITRLVKLKDSDAKNGEIVHLQSMTTTSKMDRDSVQKELDAVLDYITKLRPSCGTSTESYDERAQRREDEVHALQEALAILAGEDIPAGASFLAKNGRRLVKRH